MVGAARELDVFLDRVAQHAARGTATLMDPRYSALIRDDDERKTAQKLAQLRSWVEKWATSGQHADEWRDVLNSLDSAGGISAEH